MRITRITDRLTVAPQPATADFKELAESGFSAVINNRPDGEDAVQPGTDAEQRAARETGLGYSYIPITSSAITEAAVRDFQKALAAAPGRVFAHCKSGTRSLTLWVIGEVLDGRMKPEDVVPFGERHGYDLQIAATWLRGHGG